MHAVLCQKKSSSTCGFGFVTTSKSGIHLRVLGHGLKPIWLLVGALLLLFAVTQMHDQHLPVLLVNKAVLTMLFPLLVLLLETLHLLLLQLLLRS
jgi:hypothetical protein